MSKDASLSNRVVNYIAIAAAVMWTLLVLLDYFNKHQIHILSFEFFKYYKLYLILIVICGFSVWHLKFDNVLPFKIPVNGLTITILTIILSSTTIVSNINFGYSETTIYEAFSFCGWYFFVGGFLFLFTIILRSVGQIIFRRTKLSGLPENYLLDIALGIILLTGVLFILGALKILTANAIIVTFFVFTLMNIFDFGKNLKKIFFKPIDIKGIGPLGIISMILLIFYLNMNLLSAIGPFPSGFDSRNFYVNIAQLVADNNALVEGFQPYNWSLVMALGNTLFGQVELAIGLSYYGMLLSLLMASYIAQRVVGINKDFTYFILLIFCVTPAITNQLYIELKVDFALLFFQLLILYYSFYLLKDLNSLKYNESYLSKLKPMIPMIALIGALSSYALGIKMLNMFLVFSILVLIWWDNENKIATVGIICFSLFLFLVAGIDEISGLNKYHLGESVLKILFLIISAASLGYSFLKFRYKTQAKVMVTTVYLFFTGVLVIPWMIKNYTETKRLDPKSLLMGKNPGPSVTSNSIIRAYERSKN